MKFRSKLAVLYLVQIDKLFQPVPKQFELVLNNFK